MNEHFLLSTFVFLTAACLVVPLANRLKLGSVLGYLVAGIAIGPFGMGLIGSSKEIMHFAEFGVVMMLFMIGLELEPLKLWKMRKKIIGLGTLQMGLTTAAIAAISMWFGYSSKMSIAVGLAFSLSSTALALQLLQEKELMQTTAGESSFAVLLFQDIAVIPILILMPMLSTRPQMSLAEPSGPLANVPGWMHAAAVAGIILLIVLGGKYGARYLFRYIAKTHLREVFTAISLALIIGITLLMHLIGISPALGAFVAGMVLANSEYKHTIETDIAPFKGLLLGLFFISVGMGIDFSLLAKHPLPIAGIVAALVAIKMLVLALTGIVFRIDSAQNSVFTVVLAQGGEFAFVLFQYAKGLHVMTASQAAYLTISVALSMAITPFLMLLNERFMVPRFMSKLPEPEDEIISHHDHPVIIAGYGRFGQVIGRFLSAQGIKLTILEKDPDQIELLRRFGHHVYFGDASRIELLKAAGIEQSKLLIVAVEDPDKALDIVSQARREFPHITIFARARNRRHAYELMKAGADLFRRETFDSSLWMAEMAMRHLGKRAFDTHRNALKFTHHDEETLKTSFSFFEQEPELIDFAKTARLELERILQEDMHAPHSEEWGRG